MFEVNKPIKVLETDIIRKINVIFINEQREKVALEFWANPNHSEIENGGVETKGENSFSLNLYYS